MIGIIFTVSTACVTYTKGKFEFTRRDSNGDRPTLYYLLVGLFAVIMTIPVSVIFHTMYVLNSDTTKTLMDIFAIVKESLLNQHWPWKIVVFSSAFSLAFLIDNKPSDSMKIFQWQIVEGAINAAVIGTATIIALWLLTQGDIFDKPNHIIAIFRNTMIGFLIGYMVPSIFRYTTNKPTNTIENKQSYIEGDETTEANVNLEDNPAPAIS